MAKVKKQSMTDEERLAAALVPENEQPYKIPNNWVWTRLGNLANTRKEKTNAFSDKKYIGLEHIEKDRGISSFGQSEDLKSLKSVFYVGDILYGKLRPYLNKHDIATFNGICSTDILVFTALATSTASYINYYLDTDSLISYAVANSKGINLPRVSENIVRDVVCPLPPIAEQQRIVAVIESLFSKLDKAKELVQSSLDSFETRKAAILHKAFTGELTANWRKKHGLKLEDWEEKPLDATCKKITDGTHKSPRNLETGEFKYITAKNIKEYGVDLSEVTYVSKKDHQEIFNRCNPELGDILYIKDGATTGIATINTLTEEFSLLSSVALMKVDKDILDGKFLAWHLNSPNTKSMMINNMSGNAITRLTLTKIKKATISFPSLPEQKEIVRILDSLLESENKAKELCDTIDKIDLMKKAILARAFRGELGTNNPTEASAMELLRKVSETETDK